MRIIVGISGASGVYLGYQLMLGLKAHKDCEIHLIITGGAVETLKYESDIEPDVIRSLADVCYDNNDMAAAISSGSFKTDGMIVIPCSMKTLSAVATGYADSLLVRAVDVCLKESRKVVLVPREMPFSKIHLRNMTLAAESGCIIVPPVFTFYNQPQSMDDQIQHLVGKILAQFRLTHEPYKPWNRG